MIREEVPIVIVTEVHIVTDPKASLQKRTFPLPFQTKAPRGVWEYVGVHLPAYARTYVTNQPVHAQASRTGTYAHT